MKEQIKIGIGFIILAAIIIGGGVYFLKPAGADPLGTLGLDFSQFTQCVTDKGWQEYGASWCTHCQEFKANIGNAWKLLKYNECGNQEKACIEKNIQGFPTFLGLDAKTGKETSVVGYGGWSTLEDLAAKTGCVLPARK